MSKTLTAEEKENINQFASKYGFMNGVSIYSNMKEIESKFHQFANDYANYLHKAKVESEIKSFELIFGKDFKCIIHIKGNEVLCDKAINGFGNGVHLTEQKLLEQ